MTRDDIEALMSEPPGGENHGRTRVDGGWRSLSETYEADLPYIVVDPEYNRGHRKRKHPDTIRHGTRSAYTNDRCRCDLCREANRAYHRLRNITSR